MRQSKLLPAQPAAWASPYLTKYEWENLSGSLKPQGVIMPKRGRKYLEAAAKIDRDKLYSRAEAVKLIKETAFTNFDPTYLNLFTYIYDPVP